MVVCQQALSQPQRRQAHVVRHDAVNVRLPFVSLLVIKVASPLRTRIDQHLVHRTGGLLLKFFFIRIQAKDI